jgi:tetratricopeptide (TPR) repeat protein
LQAGASALDAGAAEAGVDCLRRAVDAADRAGATALRAQCLLALGEALVHQVRGYDDEGTLVLAEAAELAEAGGDIQTQVHALAEMGYADALAGRRQPAQRRLAEAEGLCNGDGPLALVMATQAFNLADWGRHDAAIDRHTNALSFARAAGDRRREGWVLSLNAWALLRAGRLTEADEWADEAVGLLHDLRWVSFEPFAVAVQNELALAGGHSPGRSHLERNFAMSCQLRDPCWEGCSARLLALHHAAEGDLGAALQWIAEAHTRATRHTDVWAAALGEILLSEATLRALAGDDAGADAAVRETIAYTARAQLDDVLRRALLLLNG